MHHEATIDTDDPKISSYAILFYVATANEMLRDYSAKAASRKWALTAFFNLLVVVCFITCVICKDREIQNLSRSFYFN